MYTDGRLKISHDGVDYLAVGWGSGAEQISGLQVGYDTQLSTTEPTVGGSQFYLQRDWSR